QLAFLRHIIEDAGYRVLTAANGQDALQTIVEHHIRIVISDWTMPVMDGLELSRRIRALKQPHYVYLILLTIHTEKHHVVEALEAEVADFLTKPPREPEVLACVRSAARTIAMHDELVKKSQGSEVVNVHLSDVNDKLKKLAITDDLTGLFNRRHAMQRLDES